MSSFEVRREAEPQMRFASRPIDRPFGAGVEGDAGLGGGLHQLRDIDPVGQLHPQEDAALRLPRLDRGAELALDRLDHRVELVLAGPALSSSTWSPKFCEKYSATTICSSAPVPLSASRLQATIRLMNVPVGDDVAEPQRRRQGLRERADMDDLRRVERIERRRRRAAAPGQVGVALVLEDRHAVFAGERRGAAWRRSSGMMLPVGFWIVGIV